MSRRQQTHGGAQHHKVRTFLRWSRLIETGKGRKTHHTRQCYPFFSKTWHLEILLSNTPIQVKRKICFLLKSRMCTSIMGIQTPVFSRTWAGVALASAQFTTESARQSKLFDCFWKSRKFPSFWNFTKSVILSIFNFPDLLHSGFRFREEFSQSPSSITAEVSMCLEIRRWFLSLSLSLHTSTC